MTSFKIPHFFSSTINNTSISPSFNTTMDSSSGRSPRRELQGPRPTPLRVHKDSHKIRKPPIAPQPVPGQHQHQQHQQGQSSRPPVIIYTVSPKIIHANPNEFMSLVQRLTGPNSSGLETSPTASSSSYAFQEPSGGAISPAARFASIEKTNSPVGRKSQVVYDDQGYDDNNIGGIDIGTSIQRTSQFPGILSPNPNTLPPIPSNFFSNPPTDYNNPMNYFNDFSPVLLSNRNYNNDNNNFAMPSPFFSPQINLPSPNTLDLFNSLFDL